MLTVLRQAGIPGVRGLGIDPRVSPVRIKKWKYFFTSQSRTYVFRRQEDRRDPGGHADYMDAAR